MVVIRGSFGTCTASDRDRCAPAPTWPYLFQPQAHTDPSSRSARLWDAPPTTAVAPATSWTRVLLNVMMNDWSPSWPYSLAPHAQTTPAGAGRLAVRAAAEPLDGRSDARPAAPISSTGI